MYGGFDVYKTYLAVKLHFTTDSYDFHKYGGKSNAKLDTFTKRNDRYMFHKLSRKYNEEEVVDFFVANFLHNQKKWVGNLLDEDGHEVYLKWRKYNQSVKYNFKSDCNNISSDFYGAGLSFNDGFGVSSGQHPMALKLYLRKRIHIQTLGILDGILGFSNRWNRTITEKVVWPEVNKKLQKMKGFVNYNETECKMIMKEVFV